MMGIHDSQKLWWTWKTGRRSNRACEIVANPAGCTDRNHGVNMIQTSL
jgi:hypothetical protein